MILGKDPSIPYPVKQPVIQYELITGQIEKYGRWFKALSKEERSGWLGHWIRNRIKMYDEAINQHFDLN